MSHTPAGFINSDETVKATVLQLVRDIGSEAVNAGGATVARLLERLAMLWIHLALTRGLGRDWAFGLLRRDVSKP